jgi:hypothetical protein
MDGIEGMEPFCATDGAAAKVKRAARIAERIGITWGSGLAE